MGKARGITKAVAIVLAVVLAWGTSIPAFANSVDDQSGKTFALTGASSQTFAAQGALVAQDAQTAFASLEGSGTQSNPYKLKSASDYATLRTAVNNEGVDCDGLFFEQTRDITLPTGTTGAWTPIGCLIDPTKPGIDNGNNMRAFRGTLDGGNHLLTVPEGSKPLFSYVRGATIQNLKLYGKRIEGSGLIDNMVGVGLNNDTSAVTIENVTIKSGTNILESGFLTCKLTTNQYSGTSAGYVSTIRNCTVEEGVVIGYDGTQSKVGSIAGRFNGTIENCTSAATVKGQDFVGGIVGGRDAAMGSYVITGCSFTGAVEAEGEYVGGIAGGNYDGFSAPNGVKPTIQSCSVSGSVTGGDYVGGILGGDSIGLQAWNDAVIANNTVTGQLEINSGFAIGGIVGLYANLNKHDIFRNNCFKDDCGPQNAFGYVVSVDTSNPAYAGTATEPFGIDAATEAYYYCSDNSTQAYRQKAGTAIKRMLDNPTPESGMVAAITHQNEARTDDPLGADAFLLAYSNATGELENTCIRLSLSGDYKTDYVTGEPFSTDGMVITGTWTDGTSRQVNPADCTITGFDSSRTGYQTVSISYGYGVAKFQVLVTNGASVAFNPNVTGTVYLSVSDGARYRVSDGPVNNIVMWRVPIKLADVAAWANTPAYEALGLQKYANFAPMGADYRYTLTVMQLFAYANERFSSVGAAGLEFSGSVGSSFMKNGFFGHDDNLNYYVNGDCPTDASGAMGITSERIALKSGMYVDVAMFSDRAFHEDPLAGYRYFVGSAGKPIHAAPAKVGTPAQFKLTRIYEFTFGYKPESGCTVYWGTESDWRTWATKGTAPTSNRSGKVKTTASGIAKITFPQVGTYYVWAAGSKGEASGEHANSIVSTPGAMKVVVSRGANSVVPQTYSVSKTIAASTLKSQAVKVALPKVTTKSGTAKWVVATADAKKVLSLNGSNVVVKKGAKAGTYTIKLKATVAESTNYNAATSKVVTVKVIVK